VVRHAEVLTNNDAYAQLTPQQRVKAYFDASQNWTGSKAQVHLVSLMSRKPDVRWKRRISKAWIFINSCRPSRVRAVLVAKESACLSNMQACNQIGTRREKRQPGTPLAGGRRHLIDPVDRDGYPEKIL